jgi:hypothetical protein
MGAMRGRPAAAACVLCSGVGGGRRRLAGPSGLKGRMGRLGVGPIGLKVEGKSFQNKNWIFEYTKALEICRRRFRMNFDMGIYPKFF